MSNSIVTVPASLPEDVSIHPAFVPEINAFVAEWAGRPVSAASVAAGVRGMDLDPVVDDTGDPLARLRWVCWSRLAAWLGDLDG